MEAETATALTAHGVERSRMLQAESALAQRGYRAVPPYKILLASTLLWRAMSDCETRLSVPQQDLYANSARGPVCRAAGLFLLRHILLLIALLAACAGLYCYISTAYRRVGGATRAVSV